MLTLFFFTLLLNLYYGSIVEFDDIGVIENVEIKENETPTTTSELQDLLRRRLMPGGFSNEDKITILNAHNKYRNTTAQGKTYGQPSAANMNQLVWDAGLAKVAQDYSAKCIWAHNSNRHSDMVAYESSASFDYENQQVGENLFITTGSESLNALLQGVQYWYSEYTYYTYGTVSGSASCTSGKQCGHYTQLIWGTTRYVGCGYTKCASTSGVSFTNALLLVCNYYFSGNIVGYYPYVTGTTGTQCSSDRACQNGLCSGCPSSSWDTYCCQYCSASSCLSAITSNLLNPPSTCTDGLGNSMTSSVSLSAPAPALTTTTTTTTTTRSPTTNSPTTSSPTTSSPTTSSPTTSSPTTSSPTTTRSPTTSSPTATVTTTRSPTTSSPTATVTTTRAPTTSTNAPTTSTSAPTTTTSSSNANGCCKAINSRYNTFCTSISTSSVCGTYSTLCSWSASC